MRTYTYIMYVYNIYLKWRRLRDDGDSTATPAVNSKYSEERVGRGKHTQ